MQKTRILEAFAKGIAPAQRLPLAEWAAKHVRLARSSRSTFADLEATPWLIEPLEAIFKNELSEVALCAPPGSGKSTLLEIAATYIVAERPGPTLFATLTDDEAKNWHDTGLLPALEGCDLIRPLWPQDRHKKSKGLIVFPHMPLWVGGSNLSFFTAKSCDRVFIDEVWKLNKNLLKEARARTHDRLFSKVVLVSQAGEEFDQFAEAFKAGRVHEFSFLCPSCGIRQPWRWDKLSWNTGKDESGAILWDSIDPVYSCDCGHQWHDRPADRRAMAQTGAYVDQCNNAKPGHASYTFNALAVWWIPWRKLASEFLTANEQKKKGDIGPLKIFLQKRLSQFWTDEESLDAIPIDLSGYSMGAAPELDLVIITVDVQKEHFFFVVREWSKAGESRLLDYGRLLTFADIEKKQLQWNAKNKAVFLDSAYRAEEVKSALAKYGWLGLNGRGDRDFPVTDKRGKKSRRLYSMPSRITTSNGVAINTYYSSGGAKDILTILKAGNGSKWEVARDAPAEYLEALNSEIKKQTAKGMEWIQCRANNHGFDLEAMQIIAAMMHGVFAPLLTNEES